MPEVSAHTERRGTDMQLIDALSDGELIALCLDRLPPELFAGLLRTALSSSGCDGILGRLVGPPGSEPEPEPGLAPAADSAAVPALTNLAETYGVGPLRAASMTVEQLREHARRVAAAAAAFDGAARRWLLELAEGVERLARERAADRGASALERSGIGSVALTSADLDAAEALKRRVRVLLDGTLDGRGDGFLLDAEGTWEPAGGDCPRPAFGPFGTDMLGYQSVPGAPGFYLDPRAPAGERNRYRDTVLRDLDRRIDHALRLRRHQGADSAPLPCVWAAEDILAALSVPAAYRLSRQRRAVTLPA